MNICVIVPDRYPTEKAYGVNISNTASSFVKSGHRVMIFGTGNLEKDDLQNPVTTVRLRIDPIYQLALRKGNRILSIFSYTMRSLNFGIKVRVKLKTLQNKHVDLVITRSPAVMLSFAILNPSYRKLILELHHQPNQLEILMLKIVKNRFKTLVTNHYFKSSLEEREFPSEIYVVHNAAPDTFFEIRRKKSNQKVKIGYAGSAFSSGNDNGLSIILESVATNSPVLKNIEFEIIGAGQDFEDRLLDFKNTNPETDFGIIRIRGRIKQNELPIYLEDFDVSLIPYPDTEYYKRSFPLKIMEMAAAGIPMIATRTSAHERILNGMPVQYYTFGSCTEFLKCIEEFQLLSMYERERISNKIRGLAFKYSYAARAKEILEITTR